MTTSSLNTATAVPKEHTFELAVGANWVSWQGQYDYNLNGTNGQGLYDATLLNFDLGVLFRSESPQRGISWSQGIALNYGIPVQQSLAIEAGSPYFETMSTQFDDPYHLRATSVVYRPQIGIKIGKSGFVELNAGLVGGLTSLNISAINDWELATQLALSALEQDNKVGKWDDEIVTIQTIAPTNKTYWLPKLQIVFGATYHFSQALSLETYVHAPFDSDWLNSRGEDWDKRFKTELSGGVRLHRALKSWEK